MISANFPFQKQRKPILGHETLDELFKNNDVQLFDLEKDADEMHNLALAPEKNKELILRMNGLLNDLIAKEVGVNDGRFLAPLLAPK